MTALWLGGTSSAWTEAVIVTLVAKTRGKPDFSICGIITEPIAEVSATAEPEMPLRKVVASTLTTDSPPRTLVKPTITSAKATRRRAMPPSAMMAPASTKNGIVSMATLLTPSEILSITASSGMPIHSAPAIAASPSEYAIGTPTAKPPNSVKTTTKNSMSYVPASGNERLGRRVYRQRRAADQYPLDNEKEGDGAADGNRQIGQPHRQRWKV